MVYDLLSKNQFVALLSRPIQKQKQKKQSRKVQISKRGAPPLQTSPPPPPPQKKKKKKKSSLPKGGCNCTPSSDWHVLRVITLTVTVLVSYFLKKFGPTFLIFRDVRVEILIWFQTFLLCTIPNFQTCNVVWMHWKAHLLRHFKLFQICFSQTLTPLNLFSSYSACKSIGITTCIERYFMQNGSKGYTSDV